MAKLVKLICTTSTKWSGDEWDPVRKIYEFWSKDWRLVAEIDNFNNTGNFFWLD